MAVGEGGVNRIIAKFDPLLFGYEECWFILSIIKSNFPASGVKFRKCNLL